MVFNLPGWSVSQLPPLLHINLQAPCPRAAGIPSALVLLPTRRLAACTMRAMKKTMPPLCAFSALLGRQIRVSAFFRLSSPGRGKHYVASKLRSHVWPRRPGLDQNFPDVLVHQVVAPDDGPGGDAVRAAVDVRHFPARFLNQQRSGSDVPRVLRREKTIHRTG